MCCVLLSNKGLSFCYHCLLTIGPAGTFNRPWLDVHHWQTPPSLQPGFQLQHSPDECFLQLADTKWGVIGLQWRTVPCEYNSTDPAPTPANRAVGQEPPPGTEYPPAGYWDKPRSQWPGTSGSLEGDEDTTANLPG